MTIKVSGKLLGLNRNLEFFPLLEVTESIIVSILNDVTRPERCAVSVWGETKLLRNEWLY